jgi:hypothetical protein
MKLLKSEVDYSAVEVPPVEELAECWHVFSLFAVEGGETPHREVSKPSGRLVKCPRARLLRSARTAPR